MVMDVNKAVRKARNDIPEWDDYFIEIAKVVASRSTCNRAKVGAVIVRDRRILTTGYAGSPRGLPHCLDVGCLIRKSEDDKGNLIEHCVRTVHAEANALIQAALHGISTKGATIYTTHQPCFECAKLLINAGIVRVVSASRNAGVNPNNEALDLLMSAGVKVDFVE